MRKGVGAREGRRGAGSVWFGFGFGFRARFGSGFESGRWWHDRFRVVAESAGGKPGSQAWCRGRDGTTVVGTTGGRKWW
ncbi:hypothetical protein Pen01_22360 [Phytomonospora endophytica]|nr:hypothetical protein Pen01_22360 [Phytomonospora endophytica]